MGGTQSKLIEKNSNQESSAISSTVITDGTIANEISEQISFESMEVITKQTCDECVYVMKGKDEDRSAWHIILISIEKLEAFKKMKFGSLIQLEEFGRNIKYRDKQGVICQASGYGTEPPERLMKWINETYDPPAIDKNISLTYVDDDIRLCIIQSNTNEQSLGFCIYYHRHERFHYIKLNDDYQSTLAYHCGVKSFDRIIECNGINIEDDSTEDLKKKIFNLNNQLFQLLVCSPATYIYYKKSNNVIHNKLKTVKYLKPIPDITNFKTECELLQPDNTLKSMILINTSVLVGLNKYDSLLNVDDDLFLTAYQYTLVDTLKNESVPIIKDVGITQTHSKQSNVYNEKNDDEKIRRESEKQKLIEQPKLSMINTNNNIQCQGCNSYLLKNNRYKCLECSNYNLCSQCFNQRRETQKHINGHAVISFSQLNEIFDESTIDIETTITLNQLKIKYSKEEHTYIKCNNCQMTPIIGLRFKCDICLEYDLCINCLQKQQHDKSHPMITILKNFFLEIPFDDIELNDELGRGGFGTVYKSKWLSKNQQVACKIINIPSHQDHLEKSFRKELAAYAELSGPYILKTYGYNVQQLPNDIRKCMLVMEYMSRGSLTHVLKQKHKLSLRRKLEMACQIASGMRQVHAHRMIHRDLRPDNILITEDYTAKIGDMGLARVWLPDENLTLIGCVAYMPYDFYTGKYNQSLDIYTFGLTINELFTEKKHQFNLLTRHIKLTDHSPVFTDLISRCIQTEPKKRPTAIEIETTLYMYKQAFEKYIIEKQIKYMDMSIEDKNLIFITIFRILQMDIDEILKQKFPSNELASNTDNKTNISEHFYDVS